MPTRSASTRRSTSGAEIEKRRADPDYAEVKVLRWTVRTLMKALGEDDHFTGPGSIEWALDQIKRLRALVRK